MALVPVESFIDIKMRVLLVTGGSPATLIFLTKLILRGA
jgi:hypothetical protein